MHPLAGVYNRGEQQPHLVRAMSSSAAPPCVIADLATPRAGPRARGLPPVARCARNRRRSRASLLAQAASAIVARGCEGRRWRIVAASPLQLRDGCAAHSRRSRKKTRNCAITNGAAEEHRSRHRNARVQELASSHGERAELAPSTAAPRRLEQLRAEHEEALAAGSSAAGGAAHARTLAARGSRKGRACSAAAAAGCAAAAGRDEAATERELDAVSWRWRRARGQRAGGRLRGESSASQARAEEQLERALQLALSAGAPRRASRRAGAASSGGDHLRQAQQLGVRANDGLDEPGGRDLGADGLVESSVGADAATLGVCEGKSLYGGGACGQSSSARAAPASGSAARARRHSAHSARAVSQPRAGGGAAADADAAAETMEESIDAVQAQLA